MFTDKQENALIELIETEFLNKHLFFIDHDFGILAIQRYYEWNPIDADAPGLIAYDFHASSGFVFDFKRRYHLHCRRVHPERRKKWDTSE
jgi:hypothetical protein